MNIVKQIGMDRLKDFTAISTNDIILTPRMKYKFKIDTIYRFKFTNAK